MSCTCDRIVHPPPLDIPSGLSRIYRQIAGFPGFREAMLHSASAPEHAAQLGRWRGSGPQDLGVMLLEMWAYVADVLAFYDEVHAHECYLRTARREESVRDLVARLDYRPRPAVASLVELALLADGRAALTLPAGTAFRSAAFGDEPPQVFEISGELIIHPLRSRWDVESPRPTTVDGTGGPGATTGSLRLDRARSAKWAEGDLVLVQPDPTVTGTWQPRVVTAAEPATDAFGDRWLDLDLDTDVALGAGRALAGVRLLRPTKRAGLTLQSGVTAVEEPAMSDPTALVLDGLYRDIRVGEVVLVQCTASGLEGVRWFRVTAVAETTADVTVAQNTDGGDVVAKIPLTRITLDADIDDSFRGSSEDWDPEDAAALLVHYGLRDAGRLGAPRQSTLGVTHPIALAAAPTPVDDTGTTRFALQDVDGVALAGNGTVDFAERILTPTSFDEPRVELTLPVTTFGNIATATRGETVSGEVIGSGDATATNQQFTLAKSPLTYVASATSLEGYAPTLRVWVNGVEWFERPTFFGATVEDRIFVTALDTKGKATVTFGDGVRGARLPTGVDNVVATYRKGAGAAAPPAGSIAQIARGVARLRGVRQPFAAYGGADAEPPETIRTGAPRQALTLGRAVGILDMEAFAAAANGVRAVSVRWAWDARGLRPMVKVWVVGDGDVASTVRMRLLAVSDPNTPIAVAAATPVPVTLEIDVTADPTYDGATVVANVAAALLDAPGGALAIESLGIGRPLYFSRLYAAIHAVPGVQTVSLAWSRDGAVVTDYGDTPGEGAYFDLSAGITVNQEVYIGA
jgi:hypothetical protein